MDPTENTDSSSSSLVMFIFVVAVTWFGCHGNGFTEPLPSNGHLSWSNHSGFQQTCHTAFNFCLFCSSTLHSTFTLSQFWHSCLCGVTFTINVRCFSAVGVSMQQL
jgi:hypothetical protein